MLRASNIVGRKNMRHLGGARVALVVALAAFAAAATTARAATVPPPSLVGETFIAGSDSGVPDTVFMTTVSCNPDGSGTIGFAVSGVAAGPYPGTFTEQGTVAVGPAPPLGGNGAVAAFDASFWITDAGGTKVVEGTKTERVDLGNEGTCFDLGSADYNALFVTAVSYSATIDLPDGSTFEDSGDGQAIGHDAVFDTGGLSPIRLAAGVPPEATTNTFFESFDTSNGVVQVGGSGKVTGGGWILGPTLGRVSFGFEAMSKPNGLHATCAVIDHATKMHVKCETIETLAVVGTHATFAGEARIDGPGIAATTAHYRIDVDDLGEPGVADTFKIQLTGGTTYLAAGTLMGGNVQIHT
jgi:hypothetical protein